MGMHDRSTRDWCREMFERYALARRAATIPNYRLEVVADVTRHLPRGADDEAVLSFARFTPADAERRIDEELRHLKSHWWEAEWKVHDFDQPADLSSRLQARGLTLHHEEALMVLEVDGARIQPSARTDVVVEAASGPTLDEIARFQEEVWECRLPWLVGALHEMSDRLDGSCPVFCARVGGRVVGSGWIDFHGGSEFAQLSGGAVAEKYRGHGVYSLLFERRLAEAKARAVPFVAVDAAPMSRPILERKGFRYVCGTYPMRTRPFDTGPVTRA
jgi:GNAT superfamily N-acetyltransferase